MQRIFSQTARRITLAAAVFAGVMAGFAPPGWAGMKWRRNVTVMRGTYSRASGDTDTARRAAGAEQIGCYLDNYYGLEEGVCYARDKDGAYLSCLTLESSFRETIRAMPEHAMIEFTAAPDASCVELRIDSGSQYLP